MSDKMEVYYSLYGIHQCLYGTGENSSSSITAENGTDAWCLKGCQKQKRSVFIRMIQYVFHDMRYLTFDVKKNIDSYIKM